MFVKLNPKVSLSLTVFKLYSDILPYIPYRLPRPAADRAASLQFVTLPDGQAIQKKKQYLLFCYFRIYDSRKRERERKRKKRD